MKHPSLKIFLLILLKVKETVFDGQFKWGACLKA